jgi:O-antigen ligase
MAVDHPVLGIGLDNFLYRYRGGYMLPEAWEEPDISHPHNWMLDFWLQLGMLGLLSAIALIVWSAVASLRLIQRRSSSLDRAIGAVAIGLLIDTLVHGAVDNSYFLVDAAVVWWITLGIVVARSSRIPPVTASRISA